MASLIFDQTPYFTVREGLERKIIHTKNLMTVLIDFTDGPWEEPEPPHSHPHEQTSYIAAGEVLFFCEDEEPVKLKAGDMFGVPSGKKHTIQLLTPTARLVDSFNPIREDFLK
ncbi:cupin domain-containing protein [Mangrovibacterium lignilyticum]|uniref:cupin domain-containing protein n=1 Tax=Mangrovibacterium lignilyticum TaxID=2668052 RepID=UPI0013D23319|nr:cupin domain-containing protein [Mangrovibacterium lignilyticum]